MKAEHRKELQTNKLADSLGKMVQRAKEGPSRNTVIVIGSVAVVVALFFTWRYFSRRSQRLDAQRSADFLLLSNGEKMPSLIKQAEQMLSDGNNNPHDFILPGLKRELAQHLLLQEFAEEHKGTLQGKLAKLQNARLSLAQGVEQIGSDLSRDRALSLLKDADRLFGEVANETGDYPHLQQEALLGAAVARESLGNQSGANELLERLVRDHPKSAAGKTARESLDRQKRLAAPRDAITQKLTQPLAASSGSGG